MEAVGRIETLFAGTPIIETSDAVKLRAAQRPSTNGLRSTGSATGSTTPFSLRYTRM